MSSYKNIDDIGRHVEKMWIWNNKQFYNAFN